jgi:transcriptional regulator with XRE-family HTH domain
MRKASNKSATSTDKVIGKNIHALRIVHGLTQEGLGKKLGVTFQQIQKYEKGTNRVGSGRLYQIACIFEVPITTFFKGTKKSSVIRRSSPLALLDDPMSLQLLQEFSRIPDKPTRRSVLALIERLGATANR